MVFGQGGPRVARVSVGGPGLYLGNHAAATRARISGYESVLSLVGDLLDFDENIPESDREVNRKVWLEQEQAKDRANIAHKQGQSLSRSSSIASYGDGAGDSSADMAGGDAKELSRRSSIADFMRNYEPGSRANGNNMNLDDIFAAVVDEPVDPPRLSRSSVTDMMVQPPSSSVKKQSSRSSFSTKSLGSIDKSDRESGQQDAPATSAAPNTGSAKIREDLQQSEQDGASYKSALASQKKKDPTPAVTAGTDTAELPKAPVSNATPSVSEKSNDGNSSNKKKKGKKDTGAGAAALPPASNGKDTRVDTASPTVSSLDVSVASGSAVVNGSKTEVATSGTDKGTNGTNGTNGGGGSDAGEDRVAAESDSKGSKEPASVTKIVSGLYRQSLENQQADLSSSHLANFSSSTSVRRLASSASTSSLPKSASPPDSPLDLADPSSPFSSTHSDQSNMDINNQTLLKPPFKHKVISIAPGAHSVISDAILKEAVEFLRTEITLGKKVLVHCRDGNGRSGSVAIAYVASQLELSARQAGRRDENQEQQQQQRALQKETGEYYEEALEEVWKWKCDVYPHKGLKQSITRIQW
ncbi:hypothetical protein EDD21DRAFT_372050 [Dissophora ornata]|nr:hypothetical protein EDD21DRAFT_372050 [Dissophora ornata]